VESKLKAPTNYKYTFLDDTVQSVNVSPEWVTILNELDREEKNANRRETRRHISADKWLSRNINMRDYTQDIDYVLKCKDFEEREIRLERLQREAFREHLTPRQAEAFYQSKILKYRKARIGRNMGITESAVRKLLDKAETVIYPALFKALKENGFDGDLDSDEIDFDNLTYLELLIHS
jgi:hypothetical protein